MKIGIIGCGFWAQYQVAAWHVADPTLQFVFCDTVEENARALAARFGNSKWYVDAAKMMKEASPNCVDIISSPDSHLPLTVLAADNGIPVICQKPMADNLADAKQMVKICQGANIPFYIHENFRWQFPIRHVKHLLDIGRIGKPFRARLYFNSSFPVFDNQPFLAQLDRFIIADLGVHLLDVCRYLFGEVRVLYCQTQRINPSIKGEDVATIFLEMENGMSCTLELSYASIVDYECFPQTLALIEGTMGSIRLGPDLQFTLSTKKGQKHERLSLPNWDWVHPDYAVVHTSMVPIHQQFLAGLRHGQAVETTGDDNLKTLYLAYAAYDSALHGRLIHFQDFISKN